MKGFVDVNCLLVLLELKKSNKKFMMIKMEIIKVIVNIIWDNILKLKNKYNIILLII